MNRLTISGNVPAHIAERISDIISVLLAEGHTEATVIWETYGPKELP